MTLPSIRSQKRLPRKVQKLLEDDFFGHLYVEFQDNTFRSWLDDEDYDTGFVEYSLIEESSEFVKIRAWDELLDEFREETYHLGDNFYYIELKSGIREYFCRVG